MRFDNGIKVDVFIALIDIRLKLTGKKLKRAMFILFIIEVLEPKSNWG